MRDEQTQIFTGSGLAAVLRIGPSPPPMARTLADVRAAAGHATVTVTSADLRIVVDDAELVGQICGYEYPNAQPFLPT